MKRLFGTAFVMLTALGAAQAQWTIENSNTTASLRGVDSVGGGVAWASGTNGTVLRTEDGGFEWQTCAVPPGAEHLDFRGIKAVDAETAIVMSSGKGDQSRLYKTTDGGSSWKLLRTNADVDGFWDAFISRGKSLELLGDPVEGAFVVEHSEDGGTTWKREKLPESLKDEGAFAASNSSLIWTGPDGEFFGTGGPEGGQIYSRSGTAWKALAMPMFGKGAGAGIFSIAADHGRAGMRLVAVGGDYSKPDQTGAAAVWEKGKWTAARTPPHGYRSAVAYDAATKGWIAVGPNGTDVSGDGGLNWKALQPDAGRHQAADADRNWNALSLPFVVGPKGRIGKWNGATGH